MEDFAVAPTAAVVLVVVVIPVDIDMPSERFAISVFTSSFDAA